MQTQIISRASCRRCMWISSVALAVLLFFLSRATDGRPGPGEIAESWGLAVSAETNLSGPPLLNAEESNERSHKPEEEEEEQKEEEEEEEEEGEPHNSTDDVFSPALDEQPAHPVGTRCGAEFLQAPCDLFSFIDFDLAKWKDRSVSPQWVDLKGSLDPRELDRKEALVGSFGGQVFLAYSPLVKLDIGPVQEALQQLQKVAAQAELDTEFVVHTSDIPVVARHRRDVRGCEGKRIIFSTSSGPRFCDLALGPGVRPPISMRRADRDVAYEDKLNLGFWRGTVGPAARCGHWKKSPRVRMVQESQRHPSVLNASLGKLDCSRPRDLCDLVKKWKPNRVPNDHQFKYRFLLTSTPSCTYTGRVTEFLSSNSVVAMFSNGRDAVGQALHAAFQEDLHFKYVHEDKFVEELQAMQVEWRSLAQLPKRAVQKWTWATSEVAVTCYMWQLMVGYSKKLSYQPSVSGTIHQLLRVAKAARDRKPLIADARISSAHLGKREYILEQWPVGRARAGSSDALRRLCAKHRAEMPP